MNESQAEKKVIEMKPAAELEEIDRLRLQLAVTKLQNAQMSVKIAQDERARVETILAEKYKLTQADDLNLDTGKITRK